MINFEPRLESTLELTHAILIAANLTVHPAVAKIILHGSRGLAGGYRPDSDIDLSLIVDPPPCSKPSRLEPLLQAVVATTMSHWQAAIEPDLAVIFDVRKCGLECFEREIWDEQLCPQAGVDCFGLYKTQKGFGGLVTNAGVQVRRMYPCLKIWQRACISESSSGA